MAQGRGSARGSAILAMVMLCLVLNTEVIHAATFTVGDDAGWTFGAVNWPKGKHFKAGDVLVFKYGFEEHDVVVVDAKGYNDCTTPRGAKVYTSGNDRITLKRGLNYFICDFPGHCDGAGGMKIAVNAA